ncbi:hypothetical protein [Salsipaludibacter albus]|uniref:hypothetical protein n=1 Tax=Salsipaludibacter albus TaxID=2849650 RepID=UPI001EE471DF|nr:hypothetical protein [Salsipaludibacter albus]MBY5161368.1 hypothetical protein [Salsipaludibacter albus]
MERLSLAGIDGSDILVDDPGRAQPPSRERDRRTDARVMARLARRGAVGAFVGLVAAVLLLLLLAGIGASVSWWWVTGGLGLGAAVGLVSTPVMAPAWEAANTPGPGVRRVVVDDLDDRSLQRVRTVIGDLPRELTVD